MGSGIVTGSSGALTGSDAINTDIEIIYCGALNKYITPIAHETGFLIGVQLPNSKSSKKCIEKLGVGLHFADQNWKKPDRQAYMKDVEILRPKVATVLDYERPSQWDEVMSWAEEITRYVETVIIIPKVYDCISDIPEVINGKPVRLGYSIPTSYGGTKMSPRLFKDRPVHLLGGSPQRQMRLCRFMNVESVDSNMILKFGIHCQVWVCDNPFTGRSHLEPISTYIGKEMIDRAYQKAFKLSCINVRQAWREFLAGSEHQKTFGDYI